MFCMTYGLESVTVGVNVKDDDKKGYEEIPHQLYEIKPVLEIICTYYPFLRFAPWSAISKNRVAPGGEVDDILSNFNEDAKVFLSVLHTPLIMLGEEITFHSFIKTFSSQFYYKAIDMDTPDLYCSISTHDGVIREARKCHDEKGDGEWMYSFMSAMGDAINMTSFLTQCRIGTFKRAVEGDFKWDDSTGLRVMQTLDVEKVRIMCGSMEPEICRSVFLFFIHAYSNMIENENVREIVNIMIGMGIKISFSLESMYSKESALLLKKLDPDAHQIMTLATGVCDRLERGNEVDKDLIDMIRDLSGKLAPEAREKYMNVINKYAGDK